MNCPNCGKKLQKLASLDLAKSQRREGYICVDCGALLRDKKLPRSFTIRSVLIVVVGLMLAPAVDLISKYNFIVGGACFFGVVAGVSSLFYFWALPDDYRSSPLEVASDIEQRDC